MLFFPFFFFQYNLILQSISPWWIWTRHRPNTNWPSLLTPVFGLNDSDFQCGKLKNFFLLIILVIININFDDNRKLCKVLNKVTLLFGPVGYRNRASSVRGWPHGVGHYTVVLIFKTVILSHHYECISG